MITAIRSVVVCSSLLDQTARQEYIEDIDEEYEEVRYIYIDEDTFRRDMTNQNKYMALDDKDHGNL